MDKSIEANGVYVKKRGDFLVAFSFFFLRRFPFFFSFSFFCLVLFVIYTFPRIIFFFFLHNFFYSTFLLLLRYYFFCFLSSFFIILFSSIHMYGWRNDARYLLLAVFGWLYSAAGLMVCCFSMLFFLLSFKPETEKVVMRELQDVAAAPQLQVARAIFSFYSRNYNFMEFPWIN